LWGKLRQAPRHTSVDRVSVKKRKKISENSREENEADCPLWICKGIVGLAAKKMFESESEIFLKRSVKQIYSLIGA
tara:strand:+ start:334 stop:561 length:228 start_codon:yes stop_codon:yes gene_type:complete